MALRPSSHGEFATKSSTSHQQISPTSRDSPDQSSKWKLDEAWSRMEQNLGSVSTESLSSLGKIFLPKNGSSSMLLIQTLSEKPVLWFDPVIIERRFLKK